MPITRAHRYLATLCWLGASLLSTSAPGGEPKLTDAQLALKARRLQTIVEERMLQDHGMIPMFVRADDYQLPTAEDYRGAYRHRHLRGKTEEQLGLPPMHVWRAWENTASNTAFYLAAVAYQYRTTDDPKSLRIARRTLAALKYIYTLPIEKGERGMLCKPYGGVYSNQSSGDQAQCVTWGLAAYRPVAPARDLTDIDTMTKDFAEYQIKTDYIQPHGYFALSADELRARGPRSFHTWNRAVIYLPLLNLAWRGTGDPKFAEEIQRWYKVCGEEKKYQVRTDKYTTNGFGGRRNLYLPALLMEMDPSLHALWRGSMLSNYRQAREGLLRDGTWPTAWSYDSKKGGMKPRPMPSVGGGYGRTGRSALFAMGCVAAQRWFPDEDMKADARKILERLDEDTFRFIMPLDDEHPLPPEWEVESRMLDGDSLTGWLCAYWEGRYRGYW